MARKPDPMAETVLLGASNEELDARHAAELAARKAAGYPRVEFGRDEFDKAVHQKRADLAELDEIDPYIQTDPLKEAVDRHREPGMSYHFLSDRCCDALGMRGYQPVVDAAGDPVKVGTLKLAKIPERIAAARARHFQAEDLSNLREMKESYTDQVERLRREAQGMGLDVIRPGENVTARGGSNPDRQGETRSSGNLVIERQ